jgi:hypothetical protein
MGAGMAVDRRANADDHDIAATLRLNLRQNTVNLYQDLRSN